MFLRRCHRKKNGKRHTYWALVELIRTARGSRQRVVAYLGELCAGQARILKVNALVIRWPGADIHVTAVRIAFRCALVLWLLRAS